jgi:xanthine dehydrogenase accessory factor
MSDLWSHALEAVRAGHGPVLVVVAAHDGSVPGTTGASMVVSPSGCAGTVGGGVAEHEMIERARGFSGPPELVDLEHTPDGSGSLCSGRQTMALVALSAADEPTLASIRDAVGSGRIGTVRVSSGGISFSAGAAAPTRFVVEPGGWEFATTVGLEDTLTIVGGGHCALALSRVMATLPFRVVVLDDRPELPTLERNEFAHEIRIVDYAQLAEHVPEGDRSWVVVMTFGHQHDETALRALVGHPVRYLGLLGSAAKVQRMFATMRADGVPQEFLELVLAPVGLPIGSHTPEEIAISIAAEIVRERNS